MESTIIAAIVGALGGFISALLATRTSLVTKRMDAAVEHAKLWVSAYEKTLFDERLKDYRALWALTEGTSRRYVASLDPEGADRLIEELTRWYYQRGGILLTSASRDAFFSARTSLGIFRNDMKRVRTVVDAFSALRSALCEDLNSRVGPTLNPAARDVPPDVLEMELKSGGSGERA